MILLTTLDVVQSELVIRQKLVSTESFLFASPFLIASMD